MQTSMMPFREWLKENGIGVTTGYKLAKEGKIRPVKIGKLTMITREEGERFTKSLQPYRPVSAEV